MQKPQFGVSTRLYGGRHSGREHMRAAAAQEWLIEIASYGFEIIELVEHPGHVEYGNPAAVADLQQWLAEARLVLHSLAVPAGNDAESALVASRRIAMKALVIPVGPPRDATRTVERLSELAGPLGVTIAIDSRSPSMTPVSSLVHFVENVESPGGRVGICLDFASAGRSGELVDAIEMSAEHLVSTRIPIDSGIDWAAALTTVRKIGYEGPLLFDITEAGALKETLPRAREAREKMQRWLEFT
jgi:sugar phosphate isomerase/epimerase